MSSPKKRKKKKASAEVPAAAVPTAKAKVRSMLALAPDHPIWPELNDPENEDRVWLVEFVNPPGVFMARSVPEPVDMVAINEEIRESFRALRTGEPIKTRYTLGTGYSGGHARRLVECLTKFTPNPKVPFSLWDLNEIHGTFRVVQ